MNRSNLAQALASLVPLHHFQQAQGMIGTIKQAWGTIVMVLQTWTIVMVSQA